MAFHEELVMFSRGDCDSEMKNSTLFFLTEYSYSGARVGEKAIGDVGWGVRS